MVLARLVSDNKKFKKPCKSKNNIFTIYSPKNASIDKADTMSLDTKLKKLLDWKKKDFG